MRVVTGLALATSVVAAPAATARPDDDGYDAPLEITIDQLTPGVLPRSGPLEISGTITNVDLETWTTIRLYPMFNAGSDCSSGACAEVMTTEAELEAAADSDPEAPVGVRETNARYDIAKLEPGQSLRYTLRIPQPVLRSLFPKPSSGVYWLGVHALGASASTPNDSVTADGRARTFLPYVAGANPDRVRTAVVLPLRSRVAHDEVGAIGRTSSWEQALGIDGELGGPLAFGAAAGTSPVSWLLDPAVPDAVRRLATGNPAREVTATPDPEEPSPSESSSASSDATSDDDDPDLETPLARSARVWLSQARSVLANDPIAALPYGDPDLSAVASTLPSLYPVARAQQGGELASWDLDTMPVVGAPDGYLDARGIDAVDDGATLLLGQQMFPRESFSARPPVAGLVGDRPVVVTATSAAEGGPGPDPALAPIALRQRILAEAAVRILRSRGKDPDPLVVVLPASVTAAGAADFWAGLDVPWVDLSDLDDVVVPPGSSADGKTPAERQIDPTELSYPATQEEAELPGTVVAEAGRLVRAAQTYQAILGEDYTVGAELVEEALAGTSYAMRADGDAAHRLAQTREWVEDQLGAVTIDAPSGVTLSGTSGSFSVSVRNDLDQPVTVAIRATTDSGATIKVANPIVLAAHSRSSVPIDADMNRTGVHNVTLRLTADDGTALGDEDTLPLRTGQAGVVIWAIIGSGGGILFVAIAIRLVRRFRRRGQVEDAPTPSEATA